MCCDYRLGKMNCNSKKEVLAEAYLGEQTAFNKLLNRDKTTDSKCSLEELNVARLKTWRVSQRML